MEMFVSSLVSLLSPGPFLLVLIASAVGIVLGAIPGLSGGLGVALMLPVTFGMDPHLGLAMLISIWVGSVSGAMVGSILLGIPGSPSVIADLALKLGPWEYFSLGFCAIALVAALSRENVFKGLAAAAIGLMLSSVGFAPIDGFPRFAFGNYYLNGGFDLSSLMLGLFAIKQIVSDYARGQKELPPVDMKNITGFGVSLREYLDNAVNLVRSFFIGLWIGFLPGMGAVLSNMVAYAQAKSSSKHPEKFGQGCVDGVFASEASNNASVGGSLIPMVALGIPGDGTTAILLGGLIIHGIQPGPLLFTNNPDIVFTLFATALFAATLVHDAAVLRYAALPDDPEDPLPLSVSGDHRPWFRWGICKFQHHLQFRTAPLLRRPGFSDGHGKTADQSVYPEFYSRTHAGIKYAKRFYLYRPGNMALLYPADFSDSPGLRGIQYRMALYQGLHA
jgi:putative tricarboxylic transport membrane protein